MTPDKIITALMSGFSDSLTPPHLAAGLLLLLIVFLFRDEPGISLRFSGGMIAGSFFSAAILRSGEYAAGFLAAQLYPAAAVFYTAAGLFLAAAGGYFAFEWVQTYRGKRDDAPLVKYHPFLMAGWFKNFSVLTGFVLGAACSFFAFAFPINVSLAVLSTEIFFPGMLWPTIWDLAVYELAIVMTLAFFVSASRYLLDRKRRALFNRHRSLCLAILAAVYISGGGALVGVYIQQLF